MTDYLKAAVLSAALASVAALALRAPDPVLSVAALAAATSLVAWLAAQGSTHETSGLAAANPAWTLTAAVQQRLAWGQLLPLWAAQAVGGVAAGFGVDAVDGGLADTLTWSTPGYLAVIGVTAVVGLLSGWAVILCDARGAEPVLGLPVLVLGGILPMNLCAAMSPAALLALGVAGLVSWPVAVAAVAASATLAGTAAGAATAGWLVAVDVD